MAYSDPFDIITPADVDVLSAGDDRIRELKRALEERLERFFVDVNADPMVPKPGIITSGHIANLNITTALLAALSVTTDKVALLAITEALLAPSAVTTAKLADLAVTAAKLALLSVGTGNLIDGAVTNPKINDVSGAKITALTIPTGALADRSVSSAKIALLAVIEEVIGNQAVTAAKLADGAVTGVKIAADTISRGALEVALRGELAITKYVDLVIPTAINIGSNGAKSLGTVALAGVTDNDAVSLSYPPVVAGYPDGDSRLEMMIYAIATAGSIKVICNNTTTSVAQDWPASTIRCSVTKTITAWGL